MSNSSVYREIDVQKQHTMSLRETWTLCVRGVKHRLFRSMLTLAVVVLAVAFFMFLLSESIFQRSVAGGVMDEDAHARFAQTTLTRLLSHAQENTTVRRLADAARKVNGKDAHKRAAGHAEIEEASHVTGLPVEEVSRLAQLALQEATYTTWLDGLPTGHRLNLIGKRSGRAALNYILETSDSFHEQLKIKIEIRVPGKQDEALDATVVEVLPDEESGLAKVTLECNTINANVLHFAQEEAEIVLATYEGIRVNKEALHIVDGERGVYVKYGSLQRFRRIEIEFEDENYLLLPADGAVGEASEVRLYDEIIVEGPNLQDGGLV